MGSSKLSVVISALSLVVAVGIVATMFSLGRASRRGQIKATSYLNDPGSQTPLPIDPAMVKYRPAGEIALDLQKVAALAVDADDRIYVAGDKWLYRFPPQGGRPDMRIPLSYEPTCLAVANRLHVAPGRIYVGFADHVEVYDPDGQKLKIWPGVGDAAHFTSLAMSDHDVFIADAGQNVVQQFDAAGKLMTPFCENGSEHLAPSPNSRSKRFDVVVGLDDLVYVVDRRDCRIEGYNLSGQVERHWGMASPAVEDFAGHDNPVQLALSSEGLFATAEENPLRVKVYNRAGEFQGVVCGPEDTGPVADLASDSHGRILVLDSKARRVRIFEKKKPRAAKK